MNESKSIQIVNKIGTCFFFKRQWIGMLIMVLCFFTQGVRWASADDISNLLMIQGAATGEFGWDNFSGEYVGPHAPDRFSNGMGSGLISVNPGGVITSTQNLYSLFSTPTWSISMSGMDSSESFTSVVIQLAASGEYTADQFLLNGAAPNEFFTFGQLNIGGFTTDLYWAQWEGLSAMDSFVATLAAPTGSVHRSLAATKVTYFNTATPYTIQAVPEPSLIGLLGMSSIGLLLRRRRVNA